MPKSPLKGNKDLFTQWHNNGLISVLSYSNLKDRQQRKLFSVHWELKTLLYLSVVLLSTGLGILVYKNIDTIGHQAILFFIALVCIGSFYYCFKHKSPFSFNKVESPNLLFDYLLLLGCLSLLTFIGYLQYQYEVFGNRYGLASFIPMVILFATAYYFDHIGILCMAITNLAAWLGITVTPLEILEANDFNDAILIYTGILLGVMLVAASFFTKRKRIKPHFEFTYLNFGMHILFICCLAAMFEFNGIYLLWFVLLLTIAVYFYIRALADRSFYLLLVTALYCYIAFGYEVIELLTRINANGLGPVYLGLIYFIASGIGFVFFLINTNKKIKAS